MDQKALWALKIWVWVQWQRQRHKIVPAISFDEMRTYQQARHRAKRREVAIWTAENELPDGRHVAGNGQLGNRDEGLHSEWRGRQKRLARATTGYTKRVWVLRGSLAPLCLHSRQGQNPMPVRIENTGYRRRLRMSKAV